MKKVAIIGFGRFGKTLYKMLKSDFHVDIITRVNPEDIVKSDTIFYCVPISQFDNVLKSHKQYFRSDHLLIDVLSVKMYPKKIFTKYLKGLKTQAMLTHPMFGPDSSKHGLANLPIMVNKFKANNRNYNFWKKYFSEKKLKAIEMSAEKHDKLAANSQGVTHLIGRMLEKIKFEPTEIDSLGSKKLHEVMEQTCNDSWQLFSDLQKYNPHTIKMRKKLDQACTALCDLL